jgi:chromate transporter
VAVALLAAVTMLAWRSAFAQIVVIASAGIIGRWFLNAAAETPSGHVRLPLSRRLGTLSLCTLAVLLMGLPVLRRVTGSQAIAVFDGFFRVGSLVFGGGHVILPLLQTEIVAPGWVTNQQFLTGYGAAQAIPGPLTTFAAYLGAVMRPQPNGVLGGGLALIAIFLPSFLLVIGTLPFYVQLRDRADVRGALQGVNAAVVGLLLAALYRPLWTGGIHNPADALLALGALALLTIWKAPSWLVVATTALAGVALHALVQ